ncbi:MAG: DoxX family protein, partial [Phycisphaerales bacterium JB059]
IPPSTWPPALAKKPWTKILAWAVALTELFAGFFLLIGLITRLSALSLVGVMLGAIWLATLTPAIQSTDPFLGFLPNEPFLSFFWKDPFWQLLCLMASLAVFFSGPGALALDRAIFAPSSANDWDDDDDEAHRDRSSFDRAP